MEEKKMLYSYKMKKECRGSKGYASAVVIAAFLFVSLFAAVSACSAADDVQIAVNPSHITIAAFYNGTSIKATGTVPAGSDILIRITGEVEEVHLKKKGKVGGLLWMNTGKLSLKNVPGVFMVYTTPDLAKVVNLHTINLGYWSVKDQVELEPENEAKEFLFKELVKLKEKEGVYIIDSKSVKYTGTSDGMRQYEVNIAVPPKMKAGEYSVEAYAIKDNAVAGKAGTTLTISLVGFPAWIAGLAFGHELLYGIMAVFVAIAAGLVMGVLFKDKGGAH